MMKMGWTLQHLPVVLTALLKIPVLEVFYSISPLHFRLPSILFVSPGCLGSVSSWCCHLCPIQDLLLSSVRTILCFPSWCSCYYHCHCCCWGCSHLQAVEACRWSSSCFRFWTQPPQMNLLAWLVFSSLRSTCLAVLLARSRWNTQEDATTGQRVELQGNVVSTQNRWQPSGKLVCLLLLTLM